MEEMASRERKCGRSKGEIIHHGRNPLKTLQGNSSRTKASSVRGDHIEANTRHDNITGVTSTRRMRQAKADATVLPSNKEKGVSSEVSEISIQKQKRLKWKRRQLQASKLEAEIMYGDQSEHMDGKDKDIAIDINDCGVDLKPITDVLYNVTPSIFIDAFLGKECSILEGKECGVLDDSFSDTYSEFSDDESKSDSESSEDTDADSAFKSEISEKEEPNKKRRGRERGKSNENRLYTNSDPSLQQGHGKDDEIQMHTSTDDSKQSSGVGLKSFMEEITTRGIQLKMHHPQISGFTNRWSNVQAYIRISNSEGGELIEPNLVWKYHESNDSEQKQKKISLFDISSVQKADDSINLQAYPYCQPSHSFVITLQNGNIKLFEAEAEGVVKRIIHGLRWIVARLTFSLIVGNREVCQELLPFSMNGCHEGKRFPSKIMNDITESLIEKSAQRLISEDNSN